MNPDDSNRIAARIAELTTGFALGELSEDELAELHGHLTDPATGPHAASIAWGTLGTITDLRSGTGRALQEAIRLRVREDGRQGFAQRLRRRLGLSRPSLRPLAIPEVPRRPHGLLVPVGLALVLGLGLGWLLLRPHTAPATVTEVVGRVAIGSRLLTPGSAVDLQPSMVVPVQLGTDARLRLAWGDGSAATIIGPASAVPQPAALSLVQGAAVIDARAPFILGLPDGRLVAGPGTRILAEVADGASTVALDRGAAQLDGHPLAPGMALDADRPDQAYPLEAISPAPAQPVLGTAGCWRLSGTLTWTSPHGSLEIRCDTRRGETSFTVTPGRLAVTDHRGRTLIPLAGPPLAEQPLLLRSSGCHLVLTIGDAELYDERVPVHGLQFHGSDGGTLSASGFATGPTR